MLVRQQAQASPAVDGLSQLRLRGSAKFGQQPSLGEDILKELDGHETEDRSAGKNLLASAAATFISVAFSRSFSLERSFQQLSLRSSFSAEEGDAKTTAPAAAASAQICQETAAKIPAVTHSTAQIECASANSNGIDKSVAERAAHSIGVVLQQEQQQRQDLAPAAAGELSTRRIAFREAEQPFSRPCALTATPAESLTVKQGKAAAASSSRMKDDLRRLSLTASRVERVEAHAATDNAVVFLRDQPENSTFSAREKDKKTNLNLCPRKRQLPFPPADRAVIVEDVHARLGEAGMRDLLAASDALSMRVFDQKCLESLSKKKWLLQVMTDCVPGSRSTVADHTLTKEQHTQEQQLQQRQKNMRTICENGIEEENICSQYRNGKERELQQLQSSGCEEKTYAAAGEEGGRENDYVNVAGHKVEGEQVEELPCDIRCLGFIVYRVDVQLHAVQIGKLAVLESCRGRGYGKKLVRRILQLARRNRSIAFVSLSAIRSAVTFYARLGFKGHEDMVVDEELNAPQLYMEMQLRRRPSSPGKKALTASGTRRKNCRERGARR